MPSVPSHSHPRDAYNSRSRAFFRQFVAPEFQTSGYRHRFATPDPPKAVARIRSRPLERAALRCCHLGCRTFSGATIFFIPNTERWPHGSKRRIRPAERARQR